MERASSMVLTAVVTEYLSLSKLISSSEYPAISWMFTNVVKRGQEAKCFSDCTEKLHLGWDNQSDSSGPALR